MIRFNPCGAVCDFGRRPYTTKAKLFRDDDTEVALVWYPANPDAPTLPFPSAITSLDWATVPHRPTPVGEVFGAPRLYNHQRPKPGADGLHQCGTEDDFRNGCKLDVVAPLVLYRADGLPVCCSVELKVGAGGLLLGGEATVSGSAPWLGAGGLLLGGFAVVGVTAQIAGTGGLRIGGRATIESNGSWVGLGGLLFGGSGRITSTGSLLGVGGLLIGGSAVVQVVDNVIASGGLLLGGRATIESNGSWVGLGGLLFGGTATVGGGGSMVGLGGLLFGGEATVEVIPGGPCNLYEADVGGTVYTLPQLAPDFWTDGVYELELIAGTVWYLRNPAAGWEWSLMGWDGHGCEEFPPVFGGQPDATVCCAD